MIGGRGWLVTIAGYLHETISRGIRDSYRTCKDMYRRTIVCNLVLQQILVKLLVSSKVWDSTCGRHE